MSGWIVGVMDQMGYVGIGLLMLLETIFPPLPSEVIMPLAGMQAGRGTRSLAGVVAAGSAGAMAGNVLWFAAARRVGTDRLRGLVERHGRLLTLDWPQVERGSLAIRRTGPWFLGFGRLVPTIRSVISIPAGLLRLPWPSFLLWSTLGTIGWTALLAGAGAYLGQRFGIVERFVAPIATAIVVLLAGLYLWRVATWRKGAGG